MKWRAVYCVVVSGLLLAGCPSVYHINRLPDSAPLAHAAPITASADYVHDPSGYAFPLAVAGFRRVVLFRYDTAGLDISAGYNAGAPDCLTRLTIYIAPTPRESFVGADPAVVRAMEAQWLNSAYEHWKAEIASGHPQVQLLMEGEWAQQGRPGRKAVYAIGADQSELFVSVDRHTWFVTYRISFPASCAASANALLQGFFEGWHGRAAP